MTRPAGYWDLLSGNRDFRFLFASVTISFFGDWFTQVALYEMVQTLSTAAVAVSLVLVCRTLPIFLVAPLAGPIVDRFDRRVVMLWTMALRGVLTLGLLVGWYAGSVEAILATEVARAVVGGVFIPCREAALPQVVDDEELAPAMALNGGAWSVMLALGAAVGGLVTAWLGVTGALLVDAATFVVASAFVVGLPPLPPREEGDDSEVRFVTALRDLARRPYLAVLLSMKSGQALGTAALVAIPFYGNGLFAATAGPGFVGLLYAARGFGAMFGSLGLRRIIGDADVTLRRALPVVFLVQVVALLGIARAPSMAWSAAGFVLIGVGNAGVWVFSGILAQRTIEGSMRGRFFSIEFGVMTLVSSGSALAAGALMDGLGWDVREVVGAVALVLLVPMCVAVGLALWRPVAQGAGS